MFGKPLNWKTIIWLVVIHLSAGLGWYFFTWQAVIVFAVLAWVTGGLGICLGYHRLLTHSSFQTYQPIKWLLVLFGLLSGARPIRWVAVHREHHENSDQPGDPHSPKNGFFWAHMLWFIPQIDKEKLARKDARYAPDLLKDPGLRFLERTFAIWHILLALGLFALGCLWDTYTGASFLVWGMSVRLAFALHSTWLVNSAAHRWGVSQLPNPG